jgi:hypothetical protein
MNRFMQDVQYALRQLRKAAGFTLTAVLTLALGIGANAAIFTLVHAVLLRNLPVADPKTLVRVGDTDDCCVNGGTPDENKYSLFAYDLYKHLRDNTPEFEQLAAMQAGFGYGSVTARSSKPDALPKALRGELVSGNYFQTFGLRPYAGRLLASTGDMEGAPMAAVMSYQTWQRDYAQAPSVVGSTFVLNTNPVTIIGITPPGFYPGGVGIANMQQEYGKGLKFLMWISALVLLIACANIANLVLVRGLARRAETSIRMALGAQRKRLIRQMLTESVLLSCLGGVAGLIVAYSGTKVLLAMAFPDATNLPIDASPSPEVLLFAFGLSLLTGLVFGIASAWVTSSSEPAEADDASTTCAHRHADADLRCAAGQQCKPSLRTVRLTPASRTSEAMLQAVIGLAIGVPVALLCVRFVQSQLYSVAGHDAGVLSFAIAILAFSAFAAGLIPARRAASTDPVKALRTE